MRSEGDEVDYKVGDKVLVDNNGALFVGEVIRITPKGFVVIRSFANKGTYTFYSNGFERTSNTWHRMSMRHLTQDDVNLMSLTKARRHAKANFDRCWTVLSKTQVDEIIEVLKKAEGYKE